MKKDNHYVSNADFYIALKEYKELRLEAEKNGLPTPRIPEYIGTCIFKIANRFSYRPNFINYTYRDEMVSDGIENCLTYLNNFDPDKSKNPFAYFTQIIYYAFLRRIQREKKQVYVRHKVFQQKVLDGTMHTLAEHSDIEDLGIDFSNDTDYMNNFIELFEDKLEEKKKAKHKKTILDLVDLDDEVAE
jgi:DNA-directed RNA polymerase specialized sigma24 family protein